MWKEDYVEISIDSRNLLITLCSGIMSLFVRFGFSSADKLLNYH